MGAPGAALYAIAGARRRPGPSDRGAPEVPMLHWLLDGSALLVGAHLLDPATGAWTALPVGPDDALATGPGGQLVALELGPDGPTALRWVAGPLAPAAAPLSAGALPTGPSWRWAHAAMGARALLWGADTQTGDTACAWVAPGAPPEPTPCPPSSMVQITGLQATFDGGLVVESVGEGHPAVDLLRPAPGGGWEAATLPWVDLYPYGWMQLLPRSDGSYDIFTTCQLGPARPCLPALEAVDPPARRYRWVPGVGQPYAMPWGARPELAPNPTNAQLAWRREGQICLGGPRGKGRCLPLPPQPAPPAAPPG